MGNLEEKDKTGIQIFISYSHENKKQKSQLHKYLRNLEQIYNVNVWHDGEIPVGGELKQTIIGKLERSDIILLLISVDFHNSDFCVKEEMTRAFERHSRGECVIVPIFLSPTPGWVHQPYRNLKCLPDPEKPISRYQPQREGYVYVVEELIKLLESYHTKSSSFSQRLCDASNQSPTPGSPVPHPPTPLKTVLPDIPRVKLYVQGQLTPIPATQELVDAFCAYPDKLIKFYTRASEMTQKHKKRYYNENKTRKDRNKSLTNIQRLSFFRSYLFELCSYIIWDILGQKGVRVHFRGLSGDNYVGLMVATATDNESDARRWAKQLTPIPVNEGMIFKANSLKAPLIKSLNEEYHKEGKHDEIWVEYLTCALRLDTSINALMSMGVSVKNDTLTETYPLLQAMALTNFDRFISQFLVDYIQYCGRKDKKLDIKSVLAATPSNTNKNTKNN